MFANAFQRHKRVWNSRISEVIILTESLQRSGCAPGNVSEHILWFLDIFRVMRRDFLLCRWKCSKCICFQKWLDLCEIVCPRSGDISRNKNSPNIWASVNVVNFYNRVWFDGHSHVWLVVCGKQLWAEFFFWFASIKKKKLKQEAKHICPWRLQSKILSPWSIHPTSPISLEEWEMDICPSCVCVCVTKTDYTQTNLSSVFSGCANQNVSVWTACRYHCQGNGWWRRPVNQLQAGLLSTMQQSMWSAGTFVYFNMFSLVFTIPAGSFSASLGWCISSGVVGWEGSPS